MGRKVQELYTMGSPRAWVVQVGERWMLVHSKADPAKLIRALQECGLKARTEGDGFYYVRLSAPVDAPDGFGQALKVVEIATQADDYLECTGCGQFRPGVVVGGQALCDACLAERIIGDEREPGSRH